MDRREFGQRSIGSLLTISLLETLFSADAFGEQVKPVTANWLADLNTLGVDLKGQKLTQLQWQEKVESLYSLVNLPDLLSFVDFEKLTKDLKFREKGERAIHPSFPDVEGLPKELVFGNQMFAMKRGQSVAPHGHNNMATAFLVLSGEFHGRHYDRLEDLEEHFIIRPTIDGTFKPAQYSTVSDVKDNIHWFQATSDVGFIFNIHLLNVDPQMKLNGRVYVDPNGEKLSGGRIRARRLSSKEAYELYG